VFLGFVNLGFLGLADAQRTGQQLHRECSSGDRTSDEVGSAVRKCYPHMALLALPTDSIHDHNSLDLTFEKYIQSVPIQ